ncbi:hypothetical protein [Vulcanisaeta distributa]|uniref:hypothetical protein n=1 Tax=Vulcanisaeta distributa TaxID=164451 RepID=UPI001FB262C7|nr:hypothetical protein [Vulcanisaeta distributa]
MVKRLMIVEDTYGVDFHRELLRKLGINMNLEIRRLPTGKCNNALRRKVLANALSGSSMAFKAIFVIDEEGGKGVNNAVNDVLMHMRLGSVLGLVLIRLSVGGRQRMS